MGGIKTERSCPHLGRRMKERQADVGEREEEKGRRRRNKRAGEGRGGRGDKGREDACFACMTVVCIMCVFGDHRCHKRALVMRGGEEKVLEMG